MIRVRSSTLELFRKVALTDWESEADLVDRLHRGQWADDATPPEWYIDAGTAWHKAMSLEPAEELEELRRPGQLGYYGGNRLFWFDQDDFCRAVAHVGPGVRELTARLDVCDFAGHVVQMEATADVVCGLDMQDHKTKFSPADPEDYEESLQWRAYLLLHEGVRFTYNLFEMKDPDQGEHGFVRLKDVYSFSLYPYRGMRSDVMGWLDRFLEWSARRGLVRALANDRSRRP